MNKVNIAGNLAVINEKIAAAAEKSGRRASEITLVAVSKRKPVEDVVQAFRAGQCVFGENYVQEAVDKISAFRALGHDRAAAWHFIGHLQRNKAKLAAGVFDLIETVDSLRLLRAIGRHALASGRVMPVLLQVNIAGEESKSGLAPDRVEQFIDSMLAEGVSGVDVRGLMVLPPRGRCAEDSRPWFVKARKLRDALARSYQGQLRLPHLSMGMSGDFPQAIEEGATIVRVGTAIFGVRD